MKLNPNATYSRVGSVLLENGVEILKFTQEFPVNIEKLGAKAIEYHEKYITANPGIVEWLIEEEEMLQYYSEDIKNRKDTIGRTAMQYVGKANSEEMREMLANDLTEAIVADIPTNAFEASVVMKDDKIIEVSLVEKEQEIGPDPTLSRKEQVRFWMNKGVTSPSQIASKLGANPSYVQRLKKEIENEKVD